MSGRRMGPPDAAVRFELLDATERVLMRDGYPAITSRNIGKEAGVNQKLIYYYFETMDEMVITAFRRRSEEFLAGLESIKRSRTPLRDLWALHTTQSGKLIIGFMGMATHNAPLLAEVKRLNDKTNNIIAGIFESIFPRLQVNRSVFTPNFLNFVIVSMAMKTVIDGDLGLLADNQEIQKSIMHYLEVIEGEGAGAEV